MLLLFSHRLTNDQIEDAKKNHNINQFIYLSNKLQFKFSNIPSYIKNIDSYIEPFQELMHKELKKDDLVLIQGDFGVTYKLVTYAKSLDLVPVYSTTNRVVWEEIMGDVITKRTKFEHVIFREYT